MSNWTDVNEGMPKKSGQYLVTTEWFDKSKFVHILDFWKDYEDTKKIDHHYYMDERDNYPCFIDCDYDNDGDPYAHDLTDKVIAWMPLPEAYERR